MNTHTYTQLRHAWRAKRALAKLGSATPALLRHVLPAYAGSQRDPFTLRQLRARNVRRDPLAVPLSRRIASHGRGFGLVRSMKKDRPGFMLSVEIECILPRQYSIAEAAASLPLIADITSDSSIKPGNDTGLEVRIPLYTDTFAALYRVCRKLNAMGAKVNTSCGLHVHLDVRDISPACKVTPAIKARARQLLAGMEVLKYCVPASRLANNYCVLGGLSTTDRYRAVNLCSVSEHGTIEIRLGGGSTDPDKIRLWCETLVWFLRHSMGKDEKNGLKNITSARSALQWIFKSDLPPTLKWWLAHRLEKFHPAAVESSQAGLSNEASE